MTPCRLIIDPPQDGAWNMAVDEALLDDAADRGLATLRFYQWREPTLSLGYFQEHAERENHAASQGATTVRRLSGGGALLHDQELTYSLCLPPIALAGCPAAELYTLVHRALIEVLAAAGVDATLNCDACRDGQPPAETEEPFLCFSRRTAADIVLGTRRPGESTVKIAGSAQRRRRGAVLQHGGLLLAASRMAPDLQGVQEVAGKALEVEPLIASWSARIAQVLSLELRPTSLDPSLSIAAQRLAQNRYRSPDWNCRR